MNNKEFLAGIPLRERKAAQTKIDLLFSMLKKTSQKKLDDISVKELCDDVLISEGTFFNYFKKKTDLLIYFIKLWSIQATYISENEFGQSSGLKKIEAIFTTTSDYNSIGNDRIMYEIIAFNALEDNRLELDFSTITDVEKILAFPNHDGIEKIVINDFSDLFVNNLKLAIQLGEIPQNIDFNQVLVILGSLFYGVPIIMKDNKEHISMFYKISLNSIWQTLRSKG